MIRSFLLALFVPALFCSLVGLPSTAALVGFFVLFPLLVIGNAGKFSCKHCHKNVKLGASRCHHCGADVQPWIDRIKG